MDWLEEALCQGKHQDLWFPPFAEDRTEPEDRYYAVGKMVCEHCPINKACRVLGENEEWGLWGGTTPADRRRGDEPTLPEYKLIPRYLGKVPNQGEDLDIVALMGTLKRYSDRRD